MPQWESVWGVCVQDRRCNICPWGKCLGGGGYVLEPLYLKESINSPDYKAKQYLETITLGFFSP